MRSLVLVAVTTIFQALPLVAAVVDSSVAETPKTGVLTESYFREHTTSPLLYVHILLMLLSWVGTLPICVMLRIADSNLLYPFRVAFLGLHTMGIILGLAYKSKVPDLYPGSWHGRLGWGLTVLIFTHFIVGVMISFTRHRKPETAYELTPFISPENLESGNPELNHLSQDAPLRNATPYPLLSECPTEGSDSETLFDVHLHYNSRPKYRSLERFSSSRRWLNIVESSYSLQLLEIGSDLVLRFFLVFGFVAICTGIITMAGIFHDKHIFNGLAHFIKGGVIFFFGTLTLGRWTGCFRERGWAWNLQSRRKYSSMSMETTECSLVFIYGITNVFLEHMTAWGEAWSPMDFEHVAISLLFIGGGLCGLMVESNSFSGFVESDARDTHLPQDDLSKLVKIRAVTPINPIPAMIIFLLGLILAGHHQSSMEATMMHNQVGNLLAGASIARCMTYVLIHISPVTSIRPSRPPSELICSFCLMCGGIMLMASNRDTVQAMIDNDIHAMLVGTVAMGLTAMLMAWTIFVMGVKGWAARREKRREKTSFSRI